MEYRAYGEAVLKGGATGELVSWLWIYISRCRVTGTASGVQDSAIQVSASGTWLRRLKAEQLIPERPTTVAVTRHPEWSNSMS